VMVPQFGSSRITRIVARNNATCPGRQGRPATRKRSFLLVQHGGDR
jgi:hypothetical protein